MRWISRRVVLAGAVGVVSIGSLTACGDDATGARTTLAPIQPSSYVVREPVTTTAAPDEPEPGAELDDDGRSRVEQEYTVQSGDAVALIANRYGILMDDLAAYNEWPNGVNQNIFPGDVIKIPPGALVPDAGVAEAGDPDAASPTPTLTTLAGADGECVEGTYTIASGDIPIRIAERFDITLDQLNAANVGTAGYAAFIVGTEIKIPC